MLKIPDEQQTNTTAFMRTSLTISSVHLRMITNRTEVLFVSMRMMTLGRFRLCGRGPLIVYVYHPCVLINDQMVW